MLGQRKGKWQAYLGMGREWNEGVSKYPELWLDTNPGLVILLGCSVLSGVKGKPPLAFG